MHAAFKRLESHKINCLIDLMIWETVSDLRSCVDETSIQLMSVPQEFTAFLLDIMYQRYGSKLLYHRVITIKKKKGEDTFS